MVPDIGCRGRDWVFSGHIAGVGTSSGLRAVVGVWDASPFGPFADVMVELPSGHRILLAPSAEVAEFIAETYTFDETRITDVSARRNRSTLAVTAGSLRLTADLGSRTLVGRATAAVPRRLAVDPRWLRAIDPLASRLSPGVHTAGTARDGRREYYGVTDVRRIIGATVSWDGQDAGSLGDIRPAVRFGFSSVPARPAIATVRTTVATAPGRPEPGGIAQEPAARTSGAPLRRTIRRTIRRFRPR